MFAGPLHRSNSILSNRTNSTWREDVFGKPRLPRGAMVFTGPDGLRMHRQKQLNPEQVGEGNWGWTPERSSSSIHVLRAATGTPHPRPKSSFSDAYGWGAWGELADICSWSKSGHQIKMGTFRQQLEHDATHLYQNPWYSRRQSSSSSRQSDDVSSSYYSATKSSTPGRSGRILSQRPQQSSGSNLHTATTLSDSRQSLPVA